MAMRGEEGLYREGRQELPEEQKLVVIFHSVSVILGFIQFFYDKRDVSITDCGG